MKKQLATGFVGADTVTLIVCALAGAVAFSVAACERNASSGSPAAAASSVASAAAVATPPRRELAAVAGAPLAQRWSPTPPPASGDADRGLCRAFCASAAVLHCPCGANC